MRTRAVRTWARGTRTMRTRATRTCTERLHLIVPPAGRDHPSGVIPPRQGGATLTVEVTTPPRRRSVRGAVRPSEEEP
ncbi:hypothetical protein GCM10010372_08620 [Streptomyces tauricus]|nr:hypothetical protein GCM10010372_08620 [Streptomyces tauricus]